MAWRWILPAVAAKLALNLAFAGEYGWHRDELYYFEAGRHPAAGYVDFPPVTPLLAGLSRLLFGDSLVGLRLFAILGGAATIVVASLICRRLGGGKAAQAVTAFTLAFTPVFLASNAMFQTVSFDQLAWALVILATLTAAQRPTASAWGWLGAAIGLALMTKYTSAVLVVALLTGYALARPAVLRDRRLGLAAVVALVLVLPNLAWQAGHEWASVDFIVDPPPSASDESRSEFVLNLLLFAGPPVGVALAFAGAVRLWREPVHRPLAVAAAFVVLAFFATGGKSYYAAPILTVLVPAGAIAVEGLAAGRRWIAPAVAVSAALAILPALPLVLPVRSEEELADSGLWEDRTDYADEIGWPELAQQVARAHRALPPGSAVVTANYGEAGAVNLRRERLGLPVAVSRHLTHRFWGPGESADATSAILVGLGEPVAARLCRSHRLATRLRNHLGIRNEEWGQPVYACRLRAPLRELWLRAGREA